MRVLVTGGTGSIGAAVVRVLIERGHAVLALGRSVEARAALEALGAATVSGDIREPGEWIHAAYRVDAVVHAAAVWGDDTNDVDRRFVEIALETLGNAGSPKAFLYTGGCWLYGATGDAVATEATPYDPLSGFAASIPLVETVLSDEKVRGMVIHPAMVYERDGGIFEYIFEDVARLGFARIISGEDVRWPLVHRDDLAELYALMLEQGEAGDVYNGAAVDGLPIGALTRAIAKRLGSDEVPQVIDVEAAQADFGNLAAGYALDQQMSGQQAVDRLGWRPQHTDVLADIS